MVVDEEQNNRPAEQIDVLKLSGGRKAVASIGGYCVGYIIVIASALLMSIDFGFVSEKFNSIVDDILTTVLLMGVAMLFFSHRFLLNPFNWVRFGKWLLENIKSLTKPPPVLPKK